MSSWRPKTQCFFSNVLDNTSTFSTKISGCHFATPHPPLPAYFARESLESLLQLAAIYRKYFCSGNASKWLGIKLTVSRACCPWLLTKNVKGKSMCLILAKADIRIWQYCREDGVMLSVNIWQCALEIAYAILFNIHIYATIGKSEFFDKIWNVFAQFHLYLLNSFYLFADHEFQRSVRRDGPVIGVWKAIRQSYGR